VYIHNGYYSAIKKNEIRSFAGKVDETGEHHVELDKPSSERQILHFHSYVVSRPKQQQNNNNNDNNNTWLKRVCFGREPAARGG
jgi:hypothetical protein